MAHSPSAIMEIESVGAAWSLLEKVQDDKLNPRNMEESLEGKVQEALQVQDGQFNPDNFELLSKLDKKELRSNEELLQMRIVIATTYQQSLEMCAICVGQNLADRTLPCGHQFCAGCLMESWSTVSCQGFSCLLCRKDFSDSLTHLDLETLKCIKPILLSSDLAVSSKPTRKLVAGELVTRLSSPTAAPDAIALQRVRVFCHSDNAEGYTTLEGNRGKMFFAPSNALTEPDEETEAANHLLKWKAAAYYFQNGSLPWTQEWAEMTGIQAPPSSFQELMKKLSKLKASELANIAPRLGINATKKTEYIESIVTSYRVRAVDPIAAAVLRTPELLQGFGEEGIPRMPQGARRTPDQGRGGQGGAAQVEGEGFKSQGLLNPHRFKQMVQATYQCLERKGVLEEGHGSKSRCVSPAGRNLLKEALEKHLARVIADEACSAHKVRGKKTLRHIDFFNAQARGVHGPLADVFQ